MNTARNTCTECGADLTNEAARGLCPRCLLQVGMGSQTDPNATVVAVGGAGPRRALPNIDELFGPYRILRLLGRGGMGVVYEAEEQETGRRIALKVLGRHFDSPKDRSRFLREGRLAASINHPNSVYVFGTEEIDGTPTISMELVSGGTLSERVKHGGPMPVSAAVDAILQIIAGLEAAQAIGILHRDVKPGNCFEDTDGTVKIGDFGLSISTEARAETGLTTSGVMVGTPAYCSPEQLRGDELNARSDMYSVGGTLFFLLTGRVPFEGNNLAQLTANVLEKTAPSPRDFRKEIPKGLANVILRCLAKQPADRFKSYDDLRQALAPYTSTAPTPATMSLRLLAGVLDAFLLGVIGQIFMFLCWGNPMQSMSALNEHKPESFLFIFGSVFTGLLYYALSESIWGATAGKALCRLRVVRPDKNPPDFLRALLRASIYAVLPVVPYWVAFGIDPTAIMNSSLLVQILFGSSSSIILALLFSTVRRRNGFAAVQDLASKTRVISRMALATRPLLPASDPQPPAVDCNPVIGPYHVMETLETTSDGVWLLGYDLRLLRKVWIHTVSPGASSVPAALRNISRVGRLRWLSGRRTPAENWDAFEGVSGKPLWRLVQERQPWSQVRFWIYDLAREITTAEKEGTLPPVLALDRVWITGDGRAKLLDFPAPGLSAADHQLAESSSAAPSLPETDREKFFLNQVAVASLEGRPDAAVKTPCKIAARLPLHACNFLKNLPQISSADAVADTIKPLLQRVTVVTRLRRAAVLAGCLAFPLWIMIFLAFSLTMMTQWRQSNPGIMELSNLLQQRQFNWVMGKQQKANFDHQLEIYIASHYRAEITEEASWKSVPSLSTITGESRLFAEQCVADHPVPTAKEIADAEAAIKPHLPKPEVYDSPIFVMLPVMLICYLFVPTLFTALVFRGGLILRIAGMTFVRRDGAPASRLRIFWRTLVAYSPLFVLAVAMGPIIHGPGYKLLSDTIVLAAYGSLVILSTVLLNRSMPDRLAGTWPVPR